MTIHVTNAKRECAEIPEFERLNYFYGQMLGAADFRAEQSYFREKLKLHNRCLHGYGVVCGLDVKAVPVDSCCEPADQAETESIRAELAKIDGDIASVRQKLSDPKLEDQQREQLEELLVVLKARREEARRALEGKPARNDHCDDGKEPEIKVAVNCGFALDCHGNELVLRHTLHVDLWSSLKPSEQKRLQDDGKGVIYLSLCYCAEPTYPSRPVLPDNCGIVSDCSYGRQRDAVKLRIGLEAPAVDERCELCCSDCMDDCLLLAKIAWQAPGAIRQDDIDNSVRRPVALYVPTVITGISWQHGKTYSPTEAKAVLGTATDFGHSDGITVTFSRPVYAETLTRGVVELWRVQGGRGLRGMISNMEGCYVNKPDSGLITSFTYRDESGETLNDGDRVLIIIRGDFILDACCRPLDGNHVGGRVPQLAETKTGSKDQPQDSEKPGAYGNATQREPWGSGKPMDRPDGNHHPDNDCGADGPCRLPPGGIGPWTSGNGTTGGSFESWFYID